MGTHRFDVAYSGNTFQYIVRSMDKSRSKLTLETLVCRLFIKLLVSYSQQSDSSGGSARALIAVKVRSSMIAVRGCTISFEAKGALVHTRIANREEYSKQLAFPTACPFLNHLDRASASLSMLLTVLHQEMSVTC